MTIARWTAMQRGLQEWGTVGYSGVESLGRTLLVIGLVLAAVGAVLWLFGRSGGGLLPGDIVVERKNVRLYFPIVTCVVVSLVLTVIAWLMRR